MQLQQALRTHFGHTAFRGQQQAVCEALLAGKDVLAVFPTGAGKSLCYQLPAVLLPGTTIVLSPLISLMQDQVQQLRKKGIAATYLSSSLNSQQYHEQLELVRHGTYKLVYCAPEQLEKPALRRVLQKITVSLLVIDEAHCISAWGHDFRPQYRQIAQLLHGLTQNAVPCAAFTGTATQATQQDIVEVLQLRKPASFTQSLFRANLHLSVLEVTTRAAKEVVLLSLLLSLQDQPTIIYCSTRAQTEYCVALLQRAFGTRVAAAAYHAGMSAEDRSAVQQLFTHNKLQCIAATSAFGMGVDKSDIGCIIHFQIPGSLEQYVQEVGRAGRGGEAAACFLLNLSEDHTIQKELAAASTQHEQRLEQFNHLLQFCERHSCRHQQVSAYFAEQLAVCESSCDACCDQHFSELKHAHFLSKMQKARLNQLLEIRARMSVHLQYEESYLLTEQQVWWLSFLEQYDAANIQRVPGIGTGWISRYHQLFSEIHGKICDV